MVNRIKHFLARQARKPRGWFGRVVATRVFDKTNRDLRRFGLQIMDPQKDDRILEIGFGAGQFLTALLPRIEKGRVYGIDISEDMVRVAARQNQRWIERDKLELQQASVTDIPYEDQLFDIVYTANTLYFWPDPLKNLREILRVLADGGRFLCAMRLKDQMLNFNSVVRDNRQVFQHLFTEDEVVSLFEQAGFRNVQVHADHTEEETPYIIEGMKKSDSSN